MFKASSITKMEKRVRLIAVDLAAVEVTWNMSGAIDQKGNSWPDRKGLLVLTMKCENEKWLILVMHNMDVPVLAVN